MSDNTALSDLEVFAKRFLTGRINWWAIPRQSAIINFGNIISFVIYRKEQFQVELFIVPSTPSTFTTHKHPNVDVMEFGLTGNAALYINGKESCSEQDVLQWMSGNLQTVPIHIAPTDYHSGKGFTPYAFLSIQHWLNNVQPSSVGLDWEGQPSSAEQSILLTKVLLKQSEEV